METNIETHRHHAESEGPWNTQLGMGCLHQSSPSVLREPCRRRDKKSVLEYIHYGFQLSVSMGLLSIRMRESLHLYLFLVPFLGLFSFSLLVLSYSNVLVFGFSYSVIILYKPVVF